MPPFVTPTAPDSISAPLFSLDALVFDAYGTLYDVHSVIALAESRFPGHGAALSSLWRTKQLEYTWLTSLMGRYQDFDVLTAAALRYAIEAMGLAATPADLDALLAQYTKLTPFPEVPAALAALRPRRLAILSNGTPRSLGALVQHSGLAPLLDAVISVDAEHVFKPDMRVYALALERLNLADCPKPRIGFVSSNGWDAAGAKTFGFTTFWINRSGAPVERHSAPPDVILRDLAGLHAYLAA